MDDVLMSSGRIFLESNNPYLIPSLSGRKVSSEEGTKGGVTVEGRSTGSVFGLSVRTEGSGKKGNGRSWVVQNR